MITLTRVLLIGGFALWAAAPAASQSIPEADLNFINHLSTTAVAGLRCPAYEVNEMLIAMVMTVNEFPSALLSTEGSYKTHFLSQVADAKGVHDEFGEAFCATAWALYGDEGVNVPQLLRRSP